jgi:hypothetical protein
MRHIKLLQMNKKLFSSLFNFFPSQMAVRQHKKKWERKSRVFARVRKSSINLNEVERKVCCYFVCTFTFTCPLEVKFKWWYAKWRGGTCGASWICKSPSLTWTLSLLLAAVANSSENEAWKLIFNFTHWKLGNAMKLLLSLLLLERMQP